MISGLARPPSRATLTVCVWQITVAVLRRARCCRSGEWLSPPGSVLQIFTVHWIYWTTFDCMLWLTAFGLQYRLRPHARRRRGRRAAHTHAQRPSVAPRQRGVAHVLAHAVSATGTCVRARTRGASSWCTDGCAGCLRCASTRTACPALRAHPAHVPMLDGCAGGGLAGGCYGERVCRF